MDNQLYNARGTYVLVIRLDAPREITVGRLGTYLFPAGYYLYVGSALGPGGLRARIARHLNRDGKKMRWHVDYLLAQARVEEVWVAKSRTRLECRWAKVLCQVEGAMPFVAGFGSSDCACLTHLIYFQDRPRFSILRPHFQSGAPEVPMIRITFRATSGA